MESSSSVWDDLERRFEGLRNEGRDLSATSSLLGWTLSEGSDEQYDLFRSFATQAALAGDLVSSNENPVDAWLNHLRLGPHFHSLKGDSTVGDVRLASDGGYINFLCRASAERCVVMKGMAMVQAAAASRTVSPAGTTKSAPLSPGAHNQLPATAQKERGEQTITAATIRRRRRFFEKYGQETSQKKNLKKKMTVPDLARHMSMSVTAIQGIIREDRSRFSDGTQARFLTLIGVTRSRWYAK